MSIKTANFDEIKEGDNASVSKTVTEADVMLFAGITGDFNPLHVNEEFAKTTMFKRRLVHGAFSSGLISAVLGMKLPGPGSIYLRQTLDFLAPVKLGDVITACVEVIELLEKNRIRLITTCTNQEGIKVVEGEALVVAPR